MQSSDEVRWGFSPETGARAPLLLLPWYVKKDTFTPRVFHPVS